jgi:hypothetical protein
MLARRCGDPRAAEHAGHFLDAGFRVERSDRGSHGAASDLLRDAELMIRLRGDLGEMGDAQHLP